MVQAATYPSVGKLTRRVWRGRVRAYPCQFLSNFAYVPLLRPEKPKPGSNCDIVAAVSRYNSRDLVDSHGYTQNSWMH